MWTVMQSNGDSIFVATSGDGKDKVEAGNYAFFAESTYVEYITARQCDLMQVGGLLDSKGYGIALPVGKYFIYLSLILQNCDKNFTKKTFCRPKYGQLLKI